MRQIVLDTETTGLEWKKGNRVVEIGYVELVERRPTGRPYHHVLEALFAARTVAMNALD